MQCEGRDYNEKSDIWSLGCVLYEMANKQKTFESTNLPALVNKIVKVR
jgi:NIMA (never in mitosis gene a)-related kinase